jgi:hypothetical protein
MRPQDSRRGRPTCRPRGGHAGPPLRVDSESRLTTGSVGRGRAGLILGCGDWRGYRDRGPERGNGARHDCIAFGSEPFAAAPESPAPRRRPYANLSRPLASVAAHASSARRPTSDAEGNEPELLRRANRDRCRLAREGNVVIGVRRPRRRNLAAAGRFDDGDVSS